MKSRTFLTVLLPLFVLTTGCAYTVAFDPEFTYTLDSMEKEESLTVVIDQNTLNKEVTIRSWTSGIANSWDVQPGLMLKQVADIEFPQIFKDYKTADLYEPSLTKDGRMVLELSIPQYAFADFHAIVNVRAKAHGSNGSVLFDNQYREEGFRQKGKMFWAGAFGMKSAIRQSSLDALKKIFIKLREDLNKAMHGT